MHLSDPLADNLDRNFTHLDVCGPEKLLSTLNGKFHSLSITKLNWEVSCWSLAETIHAKLNLLHFNSSYLFILFLLHYLLHYFDIKCVKHQLIE